MSTPGTKEVAGDMVDSNPSAYRALVSRANYLAQARPDVQFAVQELFRTKRKISSGEFGLHEIEKGWGIYLTGEPRVMFWFEIQNMQA